MAGEGGCDTRRVALVVIEEDIDEDIDDDIELDIEDATEAGMVGEETINDGANRGYRHWR